MLDDRDIDWTLLTRYVAGECSRAESAEVERWLTGDASRQAELEVARRMWEQAGSLPPATRIDAMWQELHRRMHEDRAARRVPWRVALRIAAAVVLAVGIGLSWRVLGSRPAMREFATGPGQRASLKLADGSTVQLGVASKLRMRLGERGPRELYLEGEAAFDVVHDARRPFRVYAGDAVTEDLGTRFGVAAYPGRGNVRVVVVSGKVALRSTRPIAESGGDTASAVLGPRDLGRIDTGGRVTVVSRVDPDAYLAWTAGRLVFRQTTLGEIAEQLTRWFDVSVDVADSSVASRRVTLDMPGTSLEDVLNAVTVPLQLRYTRSDRRVVLHR